MAGGEQDPIAHSELGRSVMKIVAGLVFFIGRREVELGSFVYLLEPSGKPGHTFYTNPVSIRYKFNRAHRVITIHEVKRCVARRPVDLVIQTEFDRRQCVVPVLKFCLLVDAAT